MWYSSGSTVLKHRKRDNVYKNSTGSCMFYANDIVATSYTHWAFVRKCPKTGLVVFNDYSYSVSTSGHQREVKKLMKELGIKIDVSINTRKGISLDVEDSIFEYIKELSARKIKNELEMNRKGMTKKYKETRKTAVNELNKEIKKLSTLFSVNVSIDELLTIREKQVRVMNELLETRRKKYKQLNESKKQEMKHHQESLNDLSSLKLYEINDEFNSLEQI